jgi:hypothetical protein
MQCVYFGVIRYKMHTINSAILSAVCRLLHSSGRFTHRMPCPCRAHAVPMPFPCHAVL